MPPQQHARRISTVATAMRARGGGELSTAPLSTATVRGGPEQAFPLVSVSGSAWEMGFQHGEQVAALIQLYLEYICQGSSDDRDELIAAAMTYESGIDALNPLYLAEVRGLAAGSGISYGEAMLCQTRGAGAVAPPADGCTAFALTGAATRDGKPGQSGTATHAGMLPPDTFLWHTPAKLGEVDHQRD